MCLFDPLSLPHHQNGVLGSHNTVEDGPPLSKSAFATCKTSPKVGSINTQPILHEREPSTGTPHDVDNVWDSEKRYLQRAWYEDTPPTQQILVRQ